MKKIHLFLCFIVFSRAFGQTSFSSLIDTTNTENRVEFLANGSFASSGMDKYLLNRFLYGGKLGTEYLQQQADQLKDRNIVGFDGLAEIKFMNFKSKCLGDSLNWGIKLGYQGFGSMYFSKGLFQMAFLGNTSLPADTTNTLPLRGNADVFQKVGFGILNKYNKSEFFINVINVQQSFEAVFRQLSYSQNADYTQLGYQANGYVSGANGNNMSKGIGLSVDYKRIVQIENKPKLALELQLTNVGFAYLFNQITYTMNKQMSYSGFSFSSLFNNQLPNTEDLVLDTLGVYKSNGGGFTLLPLQLQFTKIPLLYLPQRIQWFAGAYVYPTRSVIPYLFGGIYAKMAKSTWIAADVSYGQFTQFRYGLNFILSHKKGDVSIGSNDVLGFLSDKAHGQSLFLRGTWKL